MLKYAVMEFIPIVSQIHFLFYTNLGGNVSDRFERSEIDTQLRTEFINALQPAFAKIAELEIRPSQIPAHSMEIGDAMNEVLTKKNGQNLEEFQLYL